MMERFKFYRRWKGGIWYKYEMTGQLPGCYGIFWSRIKLPTHRYYNLIKTETHPLKII